MRNRNIFVENDSDADFSIEISKPENKRFFATGNFHLILNNLKRA